MIRKIKAACGLAALLMLLATGAMAQDKTNENATAVTDYLKTQLELNNSQYAKVHTINKAYLQKAGEAAKSGINEVEKAKKVKAATDDREAKLKSVLSDKQYKIYTANRAQNIKKLKQVRS